MIVARAHLDVRVGDTPVPGFYLWRERKRAREQPVRIVHAPTRDPSDRSNHMDRSQRWSVWVDGIEADDPDELAYRVAMFGKPITGREYVLRVRQVVWDRAWNPAALDTAPIDLATAPTIF